MPLPFTVAVPTVVPPVVQSAGAVAPVKALIVIVPVGLEPPEMSTGISDALTVWFTTLFVGHHANCRTEGAVYPHGDELRSAMVSSSSYVSLGEPGGSGLTAISTAWVARKLWPVGH